MNGPADGGHRGEASVTGGIGVPPAGQRLGLSFATGPGVFFTAGKVIACPRAPPRHLRGPVAVARDKGGNHAGPVIRASPSRSRRPRLGVLPPWAPGDNPVGPARPW